MVLPSVSVMVSLASFSLPRRSGPRQPNASTGCQSLDLLKFINSTRSPFINANFLDLLQRLICSSRFSASDLSLNSSVYKIFLGLL